MKKIFLAGLLTAIFPLFNSCVTNPVTGTKDFMLMSNEQEIALGKQSDPEIVQSMGLYQDKALQQFINEKGQQMAAISHRPDLKYEFKIVDSPVVNAFAVPGGYVYFTRGIMAHFNNEAEFAGVLGHEIGHITARHSARQYSKSMLGQLGLMAGMIASPTFARYGEQAQQGLALLFLKFGRDAERQSDDLGVEYSTKIGYDARQMAGFFKTLARMSGGEGEAVPDFLSTHPNPANRSEAVTDKAAEWQKTVNDKSLKVNRESYLKLIDGMVYGEDPKQGFVENNTFYHPELKFQQAVPTGWQTQNSPQQLVMAPKTGKAVMILTMAPEKSLEQAARQLVEKNQLHVVESKKTTVNGLSAVAVVADQQQQQSRQQQPGIRALIYMIAYGGNVYNLMGISSDKDFTTYFPTFQSSINSFKQLTDASKLNKKPERVRIKTVKRSGTLSQALTDFGMKADRMKELSLLNGMDPKDKVQQGALIKVLSE
jgi:predicted Zn-dependent protease